MNWSGTQKTYSGEEIPAVESLEPVLQNTLRFFEATSAELVLSEQDWVLFLPETDESPVEDEVRRASFAQRVVEEDEMVEGKPEAAETERCHRHKRTDDVINWAAGVPVHLDDETPSGAFVVLGNRTSSLTEPEQEYLQNVSKQINTQFRQSIDEWELRKDHDVYETILQEAFQFMGLLSAEGEMIFANRSSLERFGIQRREVEGELFWETPWFDHSTELQETIREDVKKARSGGFVHREVTAFSREGEEINTDYSLTPVFGPDGNVSCMVVEGRDITERIEVQRELKKSNIHLRTIQENAPVGISLVDDSGKVISWNPKCEDIFGPSQEKVSGAMHPFFSGLHEPDKRDVLESVSSGELIESRESQFEKPSGERIILQYSLAPLRDDSSDAGRIIGIFDDVTQVRETEEQLLEQERMFRKLIENIREAFYLVSADNQEQLYLSPGIEDIWGRSVEELQEDRWAWLETIHEEDRERVQEALRSQPEEPMDVKYRVIQPDGTVKWVHDTNYLIEDEQGEPTLMGGICEDITEYRAVKENLEKSLEEKETLLEELHHRVKNNLQIITSLMNLQLSDLPDSAQHAVRGLISQVHAIASLHETLHKSEHINELNPETYIREITRRLTSIYGEEGVNIELDVNCPPGVLDLKRAVPCGLIVNELVSNALQHAFDGGPGQVVVRISETDAVGVEGETTYELCVSDNGNGLPEEVDVHDPDQFGLQLVQMMGEGELNGACSVTVDDGTEFCITFPERGGRQ